jgi:hypothetical protein
MMSYMRHTARRTEIEFKVGDTATYRSNFGAGPSVRCTIVGIDEKDGKKIYDCRLLSGPEGERDRWGSAAQFTR